MRTFNGDFDYAKRQAYKPVRISKAEQKSFELENLKIKSGSVENLRGSPRRPSFEPMHLEEAARTRPLDSLGQSNHETNSFALIGMVVVDRVGTVTSSIRIETGGKDAFV